MNISLFDKYKIGIIYFGNLQFKILLVLIQIQHGLHINYINTFIVALLAFTVKHFSSFLL